MTDQKGSDKKRADASSPADAHPAGADAAPKTSGRSGGKARTTAASTGKTSTAQKPSSAAAKKAAAETQPQGKDATVQKEPGKAAKKTTAAKTSAKAAAATTDSPKTFPADAAAAPAETAPSGKKTAALKAPAQKGKTPAKPAAAPAPQQEQTPAVPAADVPADGVAKATAKGRVKSPATRGKAKTAPDSAAPAEVASSATGEAVTTASALQPDDSGDAARNKPAGRTARSAKSPRRAATPPRQEASATAETAVSAQEGPAEARTEAPKPAPGIATSPETPAPDRQRPEAPKTVEQDASPALESADASPAEGSDPGTATGEKKRRGRSRRGRGRKKAAALRQATADRASNGDAASAAPSTEGEEESRDLEALDSGSKTPERGSADHRLAQDDSDDDAEAPDLLDMDDSDEQDDSAASRKGGRRGRGGKREDRDGKADAPDEDDKPAKTGRRKMFVSVQPEEQVEVVLTEEGQVQEYYVEMLHQAKTKGNIYKAVIHNVDPNLQAAFVNYGAVKNGFLQIDEVHPEYYVSAHEPGKGRKYPSIQKVLKPGQEVLVQVVKEPAGTKGAFLTTYLSLPGRFLVLTPGREQIGVSRKVENDSERARLRELLEGLNPGAGLGVIVRTVSMGASKTSLQRDLQYLKRTWKEVRTRGTTEKSPSLIYQEMDLTTRAVRDYLTDEVVEVWIDDEQTAASVTEIAEALFPSKQNLVRAHKDANSTLFERFNLQRQLDQIHSREVHLPSGGRLVIDATEALTAIDINSGRSGGKSNFEDMAYRTNMEAAKMIPLQLRLRDIGGQVVADFIEMRDRNHWRDVEKALRNGMKIDRARYDVGKIGPFGMLEIVRQRLGSSAISISTEPCPYCNGTGVRRNMEWQSQQALRDIQRELRNAQNQNQTTAVYEAEPTLAMYLLNHKRQRLLEMEQQAGIYLEIQIKHAEAR